MGKKDYGWEYLNSDDNDSNIYEDDGWEYKDEEGSDTYCGTDGSWGYKNSDGSATYYGADGSWGYRNQDGSTAYYGADGSWGYKNSDGSGSYYGVNNESKFYERNNSDDENDNRDYSFSSSRRFGDLKDRGTSSSETIIGLGVIGYVIHKFIQKREQTLDGERRRNAERDEFKRIQEKKQVVRHENGKRRKKRIRAFFFDKKQIAIGFSSEYLVGRSYEVVVEKLMSAGFKNITLIPIKDIYTGSRKEVGRVEQVVIEEKSYFDSDDKFSYNAKIIVTYHLKKEISFPYSQRQMVGKNYLELVQKLYSLGFTKIYTNGINDLVTGWIRKNESVQQVAVLGFSSVKRGMNIEYDSEIVIQYHTFKKKS